MILLHPRRFFRKFRRILHNQLFVFACRRKGIRVSLGDNCYLKHCRVKGNEYCEIIVERNCTVKYCSFGFYENGGRIIIREGTVFNSSKRARTNFYVRGGTKIEFGKNCLIAHSVDVSTTDFHSVLDSNGSVMNADSSIVIGDYVWIGKRVTINKGVAIPDGSIVGASSVVTKAFYTPNIMIAGNPAVVKKENIRWCK